MFEAVNGNVVVTEIVGVSGGMNKKGEIIQSLESITTARDVFNEITIAAVKPKPKIL